MAKYIITLLAFAPTGEELAQPCYVKDGDVDFVPHGARRPYTMTGKIVPTNDLAQAKRFPSFADAHAWYTQVGRLMPTRPDGRPNRPFTAYTTIVETVPD